MIRRVINFDKQDWSHIGLLLKNAVVQSFKGEFTEAYDALYFAWFHVKYDSNRIN